MTLTVPPPAASRLGGRPAKTTSNGCADCGHPFALHGNGATDCKAFACSAGPDHGRCQGFTPNDSPVRRGQVWVAVRGQEAGRIIRVDGLESGLVVFTVLQKARHSAAGKSRGRMQVPSLLSSYRLTDAEGTVVPN